VKVPLSLRPVGPQQVWYWMGDITRSRAPRASTRNPDSVTDSALAYGLAKQANHVSVRAASLAWGRRGARINSISSRHDRHTNATSNSTLPWGGHTRPGGGFGRGATRHTGRDSRCCRAPACPRAPCGTSAEPAPRASAHLTSVTPDLLVVTPPYEKIARCLVMGAPDHGTNPDAGQPQGPWGG